MTDEDVIELRRKKIEDLEKSGDLALLRAKERAKKRVLGQADRKHRGHHNAHLSDLRSQDQHQRRESARVPT